MGTIADLLFGRDAEGLLDLITGESRREQETADRVVRSGEWCGSTPRSGRSASPARRLAPEADAFPRRSA
ncbi:MAG: hypothetical protein ABSA02_16355 [Trebonia sp.]|jgi:hypothetical protein